MKRHRALSEGSIPQKPARFANRIASTLLLPQVPNPNVEEEELEFWAYYERDCRRYNRVLPFARNLPGLSASSAVHEYGAQVEESVRKMNEFAQSLVDQICERCDEVTNPVDKFIETTFMTPKGYEGGDLLSLPLDDLRTILGYMRVDSLDHFTRHVFRTLSESPSKAFDADEEYIHNSSDRSSIYFLKCFTLVQALIDRGLPIHDFFHLLILLKSLYHKRNIRCDLEKQSYFEISDGHKRIDLAIQTMVMDRKRLDYRSSGGCPSHCACHIMNNPAENNKQELMVGNAKLSWSLRPTTADRRPWNFASAARNLLSACACSDRECLGEVCIHANSMRLQDWLQKQAWSEIRAKTLLTIGTILPTELANRVFDCALAAEQIPSDPNIWEERMVKPPKDRGHLQPRPYKRLKAEYACSQYECPTAYSVFRGIPSDVASSTDEADESEAESQAESEASSSDQHDAGDDEDV